jgi:MFS family permease
LIATLLLTGLSTFAVGFVPGYAEIGIWGAVILTVLRLIQGIGVGGEWGGAVLLSMEWARTSAHRGIASWPQWGGPRDCSANLRLAFSGRCLEVAPHPPFPASGRGRPAGGGVRGGGRRSWADLPRRTTKPDSRTALARMAEQAPFYIFTAFVFTYGTTVLKSCAIAADGPERHHSLVCDGPVLRVSVGRIGRKRMYLIGAVTMGVWGFVYFALLNTALRGWIFLAIVLSLVPHDMMWGPQAALIAECFTPRLRYSGFSLGFHLSSITAGGPAPLIATALLAATGSGYVIALYILFCAVVSVVPTIFCRTAPTATSRKSRPMARRPSGPAETNGPRRVLRRRGCGTIYPR